MARQINRLNARRLPETPGLHADGGGLYLNVKKTGARSWVSIYNFQKKRREMGIGSLATISLAEARSRARDVQQKLEAGVDPLAKSGSQETFGTVAAALIESLKPSWKNEKHGQQWTNTLKQHAADLWRQPIDGIADEDVLKVLNPIWAEIPETATRVRARIERVLDAAKVRGLRAGDNPARWKGHLEVLLPRRKPGARRNHPAMPYSEVPAFVAELRARPALSARALEFLILTAARTSEVINASWDEFDFEVKLWIVPAGRMKMDREHRVPLVQRAVDLLQHVKFLGGAMPFKMSNMGMEQLLRRMDRDDYTVHGFRSSFRDWVGEETDFAREVAEAALAHQVGNAVERAYRRGDALEKRRALMEAWEAYATSR